MASARADDWPDLNTTCGPRFGHLQSLVEIGNIDLGIATNHFSSFNKRAIGDQRLTVSDEMHAGRRVRRLERYSANHWLTLASRWARASSDIASNAAASCGVLPQNIRTYFMVFFFLSWSFS